MNPSHLAAADQLFAMRDAPYAGFFFYDLAVETRQRSR